MAAIKNNQMALSSAYLNEFYGEGELVSLSPVPFSESVASSFQGNGVTHSLVTVPEKNLESQVLVSTVNADGDIYKNNPELLSLIPDGASLPPPLIPDGAPLPPPLIPDGAPLPPSNIALADKAVIKVHGKYAHERGLDAAVVEYPNIPRYKLRVARNAYVDRFLGVDAGKTGNAVIKVHGKYAHERGLDAAVAEYPNIPKYKLRMAMNNYVKSLEN